LGYSESREKPRGGVSASQGTSSDTSAPRRAAQWRGRVIGPVHTFSLRNKHFLLDIEASKIYEISKAAHRAVTREQHGGSDPNASLIDRLRSTLEWKFLQKKILPMPEDELALLRSELSEPPNYSTGLWFGISHTCNLACEYCFANEPAYLGANKLMSPEVAEKGVDFLIAHSGDSELLEIIFFGGEPLLNMPVVEKTISTCKEREKTSHKRFRFSMTTNGTLLNPELFDWLNEQGVNIMISMDGTKKIHDKNRKTKGGSPSWDTIVSNLRGIPNFGNYIKARATIPGDDADQVEILKTLQEVGFKEIVLGDLCPNSGNLQPHDTMIGAEKWKKRYLDLADYIVRTSATIEDIAESGLFGAIDALRTRGRYYYCCDTGRRFFYLNPDGDLYPCFRLMTPDKRYRIGGLESGTNPETYRQFSERNVLNTSCKDCWARYLCGGPCYGDAFTSSGDLVTPQASFCEKQRFVFQTAAYVLSCYLKRG
jgi:uncharacterized protein